MQPRTTAASTEHQGHRAPRPGPFVVTSFAVGSEGVAHAIIPPPRKAQVGAWAVSFRLAGRLGDFSGPGKRAFHPRRDPVPLPLTVSRALGVRRRLP